MTDKTCCKCKETKLFTDFSKNARTKDGYKYACKACVSKEYFENQDVEKEKRKAHYRKNIQQYVARSYEWRKDNFPKRQLEQKKRQLLQKYNLTFEQYQQMYEDQEGKCKICGLFLSLLPSTEIPSACVDHCHKTHQVRGLLCYSCNLLLGHARDDKAILKSAMEYLDNANS